ncbi:hypothetical protein HanIR_Chr10g0479731 [Helianthus annuus]|nr:hypothetical protein HanIR_Chr10g0479731 [Helianthus annuus]
MAAIRRREERRWELLRVGGGRHGAGGGECSGSGLSTAASLALFLLFFHVETRPNVIKIGKRITVLQDSRDAVVLFSGQDFND